MRLMKVVLLILLIFFALCLPYTKLKYYYLLLVPIMLFGIILSLPFPKYYKTIISIILILVYLRTISLIFTCIYTAFTLSNNYPVEKRYDDTKIQQAITKVWKNQFIYNHNFYKLPSHPTIYVANYVNDRLENCTSIMIPDRLCIVMGSGFIDNLKLHKIVKHVYGTRKHSGEYEEVKSCIIEKLKAGISIFSYSSKPFINDRIGKVRSGMFRIASELNVTITPIYFDHIDHLYGIIPVQRYSIVVGDTFFVDDVDACVYRAKKFFKETRKELKRNKFLF